MTPKEQFEQIKVEYDNLIQRFLLLPDSDRDDVNTCFGIVERHGDISNALMGLSQDALSFFTDAMVLMCNVNRLDLFLKQL